jgi:hypothetical protein
MFVRITPHHVILLIESQHSKKHLFSSRPANGTLTRYSIEADYQLVDEGTMDIPASCE